MNLKKCSFVKSIFLTIALFLCGAGGLYADEPETTVITINNASQTSYKKSEETGNDTIVLKGQVKISVKKGNVTSEISADFVSYDRQTEMLYAEGNVSIATTGAASGNDKTTANSFLLNTSTLEGVFDGGKVVQTQSDAINLPSGSTLIVFSDMFGKGASNAIAFKNSSLTFCDDVNPHWHIDASRTWLLPGGEFAFFNALLYVGEIPVLYLPAFYYPKDELVFNPVFGYRRREGYFIENTVYLYGRKPLDTSSSTTTSSSSSSSSTTSSDTNSSAAADSLKGLYNFMKPSQLKKQRLEGLVLHNLEENYSGDTSKYFKLMVDWYSTLGTMVGFSGVFKPSEKYVTSLVTDFGLGFSKTIYTSGSKYYPYNPTTGTTYSDKSNFLGNELPFRYGGKFGLQLSNPVNLTLEMPLFSDPYYQYDFITNRTEYMDWISYLLDLNTIQNSTETITVSEYSNFAWTLTSSKAISLPSPLKQFFSTMSYNLTSSVQFTTLTMKPTEYDATGTLSSEHHYIIDGNSYINKFYAPSQATPLSLSFNFAGTLLEVPFGNGFKTSSKKEEFAITLNKADELKTEDELKKEKEAAEATENEAEKKPEEAAKDEKVASANEIFGNGNIEPIFPDLDFSSSTESLAEGFVYKLGYTFTPSILTQIAYSTESEYIKTGSDFDWTNIKSSMYTIKLPVSLSNNLTYGTSVFSATNSFSYSPIYQKHPYINTKGTSGGGYTESQADTLKVTDYKAESQDISTTNTISLFPFAYVPLFCETGLKWSSTAKLFRQEFIGDADTPDYKYYTLDWGDENCVTVNSLDFIFGLCEMDKKFKQTLTFSQVMPPLLRQYTGTLTLVFPYVTETVTTGIQEKNKNASDWDDQWDWKDIQQSTTVSGTVLGSTLSFSESYNYNLEEKYHSSLKLSSSWYGFSTSYVMSYTQGYDFENNKWVERKEADGTTSKKEFLPYSYSFAYTMPSKTYYRWFNRISVAPGLTTSITADLIRPTNSYFIFTPSITFNLNNFFYIKFSSTTQNSVIYRYFQKMAGHEGRVPGEDNMWKDLWNSFRFDNESLRKASGFKLKSLNMEVTHSLHDWDFSMTWSFAPRLLTENGTSHYDLNPYITIGVVWKPMQSMKTQIKDNYGDWTFQ
ncbi:LPS-assembly protein LptD [Treponema sp. C6A8]|uniref:LPS-assembly protein LptD n=1 Tax=Treponema sp. C6A8 TaxID=1410609 RepID=UPI0004822151|nr:LPS-assembly protein LptD [Treponema sp. C6A8]